LRRLLPIAIVIGPFLALAIGIAVMRSRGPEPPPPVAAGALRGANVLLVTIDALRADHVGAFGSAGSLTPMLDEFAKNGLQFPRAYAHAPLALPSYQSLLSARYPNRDSEGAALAAALQAAGYRTGAFVGASTLGAASGLSRGFDRYDDRMISGPERRAEQVLEPAYDWIVSQPSAASAPWFAWVQINDPDEPYVPPEPYLSKYSSEPYDGEVAYADAAFGVFIAQLRRADALGHALVVITSDHGASVGDRGDSSPRRPVSEDMLRVPLVVWGPPQIRAGVFDELTRLVDVAPTILDLIGAAPLAGADGRSIRPFVSGEQAFDDAASYFEAGALRGIIQGRFKLIAAPAPELYDLAADPREQRNLAADHPDRVRELQDRLAQIVVPR
jgi:arylsulfatase A-like enzyme